MSATMDEKQQQLPPATEPAFNPERYIRQPSYNRQRTHTTSTKSTTNFSFDIHAFNASTFDAEQFVSQLVGTTTSQDVTSIPLEQLQGELQQYSELLHLRLINLLNQDYHSFLDLSTSLTGIDQIIETIQSYISDTHNTLQYTITQTQHEQQQLESQLQARYNVLLENRVLQLLQYVTSTIKLVQHELECIVPLNNDKLEDNYSASQLGELLLTTTTELEQQQKQAVQHRRRKKQHKLAAGSESDAPVLSSPHSIESGESNAAFALYTTLCNDVDLSDAELDALDTQAADNCQAYSNTDLLVNNCTTLERLSLQFIPLQSAIKQLQHFTLIQQISTHVQTMFSKLVAALDANFHYAFNVQHSSSIHTLIRCYTVLHKVEHLEHYVRSSIVQPLVAQQINAAVLRNVMGQSTTNKLTLTQMYDNVIELVATKCQLVFVNQSAAAEQSLASNFQQLAVHSQSTSSASLWPVQFFLHSVWPEITQALITHGQLLFSSGIPSQFHTYYTQTQQFVHAIRRLYVKHHHQPSAATQFDQCPATLSLQRRFNLSIYFQLRFQQLAGYVENAIGSSTANATLTLSSAADSVTNLQTLTPATPLSDRFVLEVTALTAIACTACFSETVYLHDLGQKYIKLATQIVTRYTTFAATLIPATTDDSSKSALPIAASAALLVDSQALDSYITSELITILRQRLSEHSSPSANADNALRTLFRQCSEQLRTSVVSPLRTTIITSVATSCIQHLSAVKKMNATFRVRKAVPTQASGYVEAVLSPIKQLFEHRGDPKTAQVTALPLSDSQVSALTPQAEASAASQSQTPATPIDPSPFVAKMQPADRVMCVLQVLLQVTEQYRVQAAELIKIVEKTAATFKRLNVMRPNAAATNTDVSDSQKIAMQLRLDVDEYKRQAAALLQMDAGDVQDSDQLMTYMDYYNEALRQLEAAITVTE